MAGNLSLRRTCYYLSRFHSVGGFSSPLHPCTGHHIQYHRPSGLHRNVKQLIDYSWHGARYGSKVDFFVHKRNLFTKWSSSSSSSSSMKEKVESNATSVDNQESGKVGDHHTVPQMDQDEEEDSIIPKTDEKGQPLSNWKRMKVMMKAYGYVIIPVHWVIAPVWFGAFYYTIKLGVDIGPLLKAISVSEHHIEYLQNSKASTALLAYALYKIFTPLRYTVTLAATEMTIRRLRRMGYMRPHPPKEKSYRDSFKETVGEMKDKVKDIRDSRST